MVRILTEDLGRIRSLIYKETGVLFEEKKDYYILNRTTQRMEALGISDFGKYYPLLEQLGRNELQHLIESLTINETYFFRDFPQLQGFGEKALAKYQEEKRKKGDYRLKFWSAACSTGEEPYTLAIILRELTDDFDRWNIRMDASDIDRTVLDHARKGIYGERSVKDTPTGYRNKYFRQSAAGWELQPSISKMVKFDQVNLFDRNAMRLRSEYDFIFCRNVLIYFDDDSRRQVVNALYDALVPGGYLFLGHSESVGRITGAFKLEKMDDCLFYRK